MTCDLVIGVMVHLDPI